MDEETLWILKMLSAGNISARSADRILKGLDLLQKSEKGRSEVDIFRQSAADETESRSEKSVETPVEEAADDIPEPEVEEKPTETTAVEEAEQSIPAVQEVPSPVEEAKPVKSSAKIVETFEDDSMSGPNIILAVLSGDAMYVNGMGAEAGASVEFFGADADDEIEMRTYLGYLTADLQGNFYGLINTSGKKLLVGDHLTAVAAIPSENMRLSKSPAVKIQSMSGPVIMDDFQGLVGWKTWRLGTMGRPIVGEISDAVVRDEEKFSDVLEIKGPGAGKSTANGIYKSLSLNVSGFSNLFLKFDIKVIRHLSENEGAKGVEFPVDLEIWYTNEKGYAQIWHHGFYYRGISRTPDISTKVSLGSWYTYTSPDLMALFSKPRIINKIRVLGNVANYEGRIDNIQLIAQYTSKKLHLYPGWNLISLPLDPNVRGYDLISTLKSIEGLYTSVRTFDAISQSWKQYIPDSPPALNNLSTVDPGKGYWLYMLDEAILTVTGEDIANTTIPLREGWNLVGYNSLAVQSRGNALLSIHGMYDSIWTYNNLTQEWSKYVVDDEDSPNTFKQLEPGNAYWVYARTDCSWHIDAPRISSNRIIMTLMQLRSETDRISPSSLAKEAYLDSLKTFSYKDDLNECYVKYPDWPASPMFEELQQMMDDLKAGRTPSEKKYWSNSSEEELMEIAEKLVEGNTVSVTKSDEATVTLSVSREWNIPEAIRAWLKFDKGYRLGNLRRMIGTSQILEDKDPLGENIIEAILDKDSESFRSYAPELNGSRIHVLAKAAKLASEKYFGIEIKVVENKWASYQRTARYIINSSGVIKFADPDRKDSQPPNLVMSSSVLPPQNIE